MREYVAYYHGDRIRDALGNDTPNERLIEKCPSAKRWWSRVLGPAVFIIDNPDAKPSNRAAPWACRNLTFDFGGLILASNE
jgi:hypothetical protein